MESGKGKIDMKTIKKINKYTEDYLVKCGLLGWIYLVEVQEEE